MRRKMNQKLRFTISAVLLVAVLGAISVSAGLRRSYLTFKDELDEVAVVVDGEKLTLEDLAFYIAYEERQVEEAAIIYDPESPGNYWNLRSGGSFVRVTAKQAALDMAVHDEIFYQYAVEEGITLNAEEEKYLSNTQMDFWNDMEEEQKESLGVSQQTLNESMRRIALAEKYQYLLTEIHEAEFEDYSYQGEAYRELLEEHDYEVAEEVWDRVHFGGITVAH